VLEYRFAEPAALDVHAAEIGHIDDADEIAFVDALSVRVERACG